MSTLPLTRRQREVAHLVARGCSYQAIARSLGIGFYTARSYVRDAAQRLDNPDGLEPYLVVFRWAHRQAWEAEQRATPRDALDDARRAAA